MKTIKAVSKADDACENIRDIETFIIVVGF
jgi:hypothetical protein